MDAQQLERIRNNESFRKLVAARSRLGWQLAAVVICLYFTFILVIAFAPHLLGIPLFNGAVTTIGIPIGIFIIVIAFATTGLYVGRANSEFDGLVRKVLEETE